MIEQYLMNQQLYNYHINKHLVIMIIHQLQNNFKHHNLFQMVQYILIQIIKLLKNNNLQIIQIIFNNKIIIHLQMKM